MTSAAVPSVQSNTFWKGWIIVHEPGLTPRKKGPWRTHQEITDMLRDLMELHPSAYFMVARVTNDGLDLWLDSGKEWLEFAHHE